MTSLLLPDSAEKVKGNSQSETLANIVMGLGKVDGVQMVLDEPRLRVAAIASAPLSIKAEATSSAAVKAVKVEQLPAKKQRTKKT